MKSLSSILALLAALLLHPASGFATSAPRQLIPSELSATPAAPAAGLGEAAAAASAATVPTPRASAAPAAGLGEAAASASVPTPRASAAPAAGAASASAASAPTPRASAASATAPVAPAAGAAALPASALPAPTPARTLRVAFVGDPQVKSELELDFARRSVYADLASRADLDLVVVLGDLVSDAPELMEPSCRTLDSLGVPWVCLPGNHDRDMHKDGRPRLTADFCRFVGPADTSFVKGGVRFVLMNNVRTKNIADYEGGFSEAQKEWLRQTIRRTPARMQTVICTHIPISESKGLDSLEAIVGRQKNLLFVCAHTHTVKRHVLKLPAGREVEELIAGTSCGTFWRGSEDEQGIPTATMWCGAPRCYFTADFGKHGYSLAFKAVGRPDSLQASVFSDPAQGCVINVFGGHEEGKLELLLPEGWTPVPSEQEIALDANQQGWTPCARAAVMAPECTAIADANSSLTKEQRKAMGRAYLPMFRRPSPHVWTLPACLAPGEVQIRYSDPYMQFRTSVTVQQFLTR